MKNPKGKGNRVERALCKMLSERLGGEFIRSVGSGNRWGQVNSLTRAAREVFSGDICPPEGFRWVVECKGGYPTDLDGAIGCSNSTLDSFILQAMSDGKRSGRMPMVAWKRDRRPWVAILEVSSLPPGPFSSMLIYGEWAVVSLMELLQVTDRSFWFEGDDEAKTDTPAEIPV